MLTYEFALGEDIAIALDAVQGDPTLVSAISAQLKAIPGWRAVLPVGASIAATFQITPRIAEGTGGSAIPPGWTLLIPAALSATLNAGNYVADALLTMAGGTAITEQIGIRLKAAVTS